MTIQNSIRLICSHFTDWTVFVIDFSSLVLITIRLKQHQVRTLPKRRRRWIDDKKAGVWWERNISLILDVCFFPGDQWISSTHKWLFVVLLSTSWLVYVSLIGESFFLCNLWLESLKAGKMKLSSCEDRIKIKLGEKIIQKRKMSISKKQKNWSEKQNKKKLIWIIWCV